MKDHSLKERILAFNTAVPRYTSYPPATAFTAGFPVERYANWLAEADDSPVSLYLHIPFCSRLCYYCGCFTTITAGADQQAERITAYIDDIVREMDLVDQHMRPHAALSHLHFGGGSPTLLKPMQFRHLMAQIRNRFDIIPNAELAIEADPRQMDEGRVASFAACGINRISLGVQDTNQTVMNAVNRPQPFQLSQDAVALCRQYGIDAINVDIMYGLPGQTAATMAETVATILTLQPSRIAFFGYAHVPWMKKHMKMMDGLTVPDDAERFDLYETGRALLLDAGYIPVGIDHFVKPQDSMAIALGDRTLHRNFQGYTTDTATTLIGLGASAIGKFAQGYAQNTADLRLYSTCVREGQLPIAKGYVMSAEDMARAAIISDLMCTLAVDVAQIARHYHMPADTFISDLQRLRPLENGGLVITHDSFVRVLHPHVARMAAACFDPAIALAPLQNRHSRSV